MFHPWVGELYGQTELLGGRRILVVGESHHASDLPVGEIAPEMTRAVMTEYGASQERGKWKRTLDNVAWALSGKNRAELAREDYRGEFDVWRSLAFYNYIPVILAEGPRGTRPTSELFASGREPFEMVLTELQPDVILVCGYALFPNIMRNHWPHMFNNPWQFKGDIVDVDRPKPMRLIRMIHPSTGFSPLYWNKIINAAVNELP